MYKDDYTITGHWDTEQEMVSDATSYSICFSYIISNYKDKYTITGHRTHVSKWSLHAHSALCAQ